MAEYARLREDCPVAYSDRHGGYYTLTRYRDVVSALLKHERFRSGRPFVSMPDFNQSIPIGLNPPEHARYRRMLNKFFIPARMSELEPRIRAFADEHIDALLELGEADVVPLFAGPYPARGLAALLNMPDDAWEELVSHLETLAQIRDDPAQVNAIVVTLFDAAVHRLVDDRRAKPLDPETDLMSGVLAMRIDGKPLAEDVLVAIGVQVIAAGHSTTSDGLAGILFRLATYPEIQARLRQDPSLIPNAIEELLRLEVPLHEMGRTAGEDIELHGRTIPKGCPVGLNFAAANRDPDEFPNPDALIIGREPNRHLTFGHGVHKCVGAPLARLELRVALEQLLKRTTGFELAGPTAPESAYFLGGLSSLPLRFEAAS